MHPEQIEDCDGLDNDCDDDIDEREGLTLDRDGDGYGYDDGDAYDCDAPYGWSTEAGDCDDEDAAISPGAEETCDGTDQDCDGEIDQGLPTLTCYADLDGDRLGDPTASWLTCKASCGDAATTRAGDCDDEDSTTSATEEEICNGEDDDCDGETDEGLESAIWHRDADADGYGSPYVVGDGCNWLNKWVADGTDCDDGSSAVNPGESESCDAEDNDCDGEVDEGFDTTTFYADGDRDGYGDPDVTSARCDATSYWVADGTDCYDDDGDTHPGAPEDCADGEDTDCDGLMDCEDEACDGAAVCGESVCSDGLDDDDDGRVDCQDDECWGDPECPTVVTFRVTGGDGAIHRGRRSGTWQRSTCDETTTYQGDLYLCDEWEAARIEGTMRVYAPGASARLTCRWGLDEALLEDCVHVRWHSLASRTTTSSLVSVRDGLWTSGDCGLEDGRFLPPLTSVQDRWFSWYHAPGTSTTGFHLDDEGWGSDCEAENRDHTVDTTEGYHLNRGTRDTYTIGTAGY